MTLDQLICLAESHGITISWTHLHTRAAYHHKTRTIYLDHALNTRPRHATAILAHEYIHALMGHTGPQDAHTERLVDLRAAQLLVSPAEYALAEQLHDANPHAIADELNLPLWVITAYREHLTASTLQQQAIALMAGEKVAPK